MKIALELSSKGTSHGNLNQTHSLPVNPESPAVEQPGFIRDLGSNPQRIASAHRVIAGNASVWLKISMKGCRGIKRLFPDIVALPERSLHVAPIDGEGTGDIAFPLFMNQRRSGKHRLFRIKYGGDLFILHFYQVRSLHRRLAMKR